MSYRILTLTVTLTLFGAVLLGMMVSGCALIGKSNEDDGSESLIPTPSRGMGPTTQRKVVSRHVPAIAGQWRLDPHLTPGLKEISPKEAEKVVATTAIRFRLDGTYLLESSGLEQHGEYESKDQTITLSPELDAPEGPAAPQQLTLSKDGKQITMNSGEKALIFTRRANH